jgi:hypothetical protein
MGIFLSLEIVFGLPGEGIVSIDLSTDICLAPSSRQIQHTGRPSMVQIIDYQIMAKFISSRAWPKSFCVDTHEEFY